MEADKEIVDRHLAPYLVVHCFHCCFRGQSGADIGLIGHNHDEKAGILEAPHGVGSAREDAKFGEARWRDRFAVPHEIGIDHPVAIKENCFQHLVTVFWNFAHDTKQCQTVAWNASTWGVTRLSSTVGMTTTQSP